jgi:hypothetical protein
MAVFQLENFLLGIQNLCHGDIGVNQEILGKVTGLVRPDTEAAVIKRILGGNSKEGRVGNGRCGGVGRKKG